MTRTGMSQRLGQHLPEPFVEIHPDDALKSGVAHGSFARVITDHGQCTLRVVVSDRQQRGMLFAPIHWSDVTAFSARVGALVAPITDPYSGAARKQGDARIDRAVRICVSRFCAVTHAAGIARACLVGARDCCGRLRLSARRQCRSGAMAVLAEIQIGVADVAEYRDFGGGVYRAAAFAEDRIDTCLFMGPAGDAGDWNVVKSLFAAGVLSDDQRRTLLSGKSMGRPRHCRTYCLRLLRRRPHHDLRRHRGGRGFGRRDRHTAQGRHQLRLMHPGIEAPDRAGRRQER